MSVPDLSAAELAQVLAASYRRVTDALAGLDDLGYYQPTRCRGMAVADLLVHLRMDAERALVAFANPTDDEVDKTFATYWSDFRPGAFDPAAELAGVRYVRGAATAYQQPSRGLRDHWAAVTASAGRAAAAAAATTPDGRVRTQGHVLAVPDFLATLVLEACVHTFDLMPSVAVEPDPAAVEVTVATLDAVAGGSGPFDAEGSGGAGGAGGAGIGNVRERTGWDRTVYVLKGTGRVSLDPTDEDALGPLRALFPLLG